jgi:hypothetical protein
MNAKGSKNSAKPAQQSESLPKQALVNADLVLQKQMKLDGRPQPKFPTQGLQTRNCILPLKFTKMTTMSMESCCKFEKYQTYVGSTPLQSASGAEWAARKKQHRVS